MTTDVYDPGQLIRPTFTFTAAAGDPAPVNVTVTAVIQDPAGTEAALPLGVVTILGQTASVTANGFTIPDDNASAGWWHVRAKATVDLVDTHELAFYVRRSSVLA